MHEKVQMRQFRSHTRKGITPERSDRSSRTDDPRPVRKDEDRRSEEGSQPLRTWTRVENDHPPPRRVVERKSKPNIREVPPLGRSVARPAETSFE